MIYGIPILYKEWIDFVWSNRRNATFVPTDPELLDSYRLKPLLDLKIALLNFDPQQVEELSPVITANDGLVVPVGDEHCTHLVVNTGSGAQQQKFNYSATLEELLHLPKFVVSEKVG